MQKLEDAKYMNRDQLLRTRAILKDERQELIWERQKYPMCPPTKLVTEIAKRTRKINIIEDLLPTSYIVEGGK